MSVRLSIITVNLNNAVGLQKTIASVVNQTFRNFEFIIIDGASTDDSIEMIKSKEQQISFWVSEKDGGVFQAMNKGIAKAKGEYLLMLNSGDFLVNEKVLENVFENFASSDIVAADVLWEENGTVSGYQQPEKPSFHFFFTHNYIAHQTSFIRRELHNVVGLYDENFKITSDWKFFLMAICKYNASYTRLPLYISQCDRDGISCKPENWKVVLKERRNIFETEFPAFIVDYQRLEKLEKDYERSKRRLLNRVKQRFIQLFP